MAAAQPELKRLRMEMAGAHPDRGGTREEFIAARKSYEHALRQIARAPQRGRDDARRPVGSGRGG